MNNWSLLFFQDASSPVMEEFLFFHDHVMFILILFLSMITYIMILSIHNPMTYLNLQENHVLESIWTLAPIFSLIQIALPSLMLLYVMEDFDNASLNLKTIGNQWFWTYEYTDFKPNKSLETFIKFNSYMTPSKESDANSFRLLDVDNRAMLPFNTHIQIITTSADVLHSWSIPALGVKMDSCPGRLNQTLMISHRPGVYFGQCSEICGSNHSFMPIVTEFMNVDLFTQWILSLLK